MKLIIKQFLPDILIRRNENHSCRKGYLTDKKIRVFKAKSPVAEEVVIGK